MKRVILVAYLDKPSIKTPKLKEVIKNVEEPSKDWKKEIVDYLERFMLLDNRAEVKEVKTRSIRCVLMSGELYQ